MKCGLGIGQKYWQIWVSVLVSDLNQNNVHSFSPLFLGESLFSIKIMKIDDVTRVHASIVIEAMA